MELFITALIKELIFPPGILLLLFAIGLLLYRRIPRLAQPLLWATLVCGYLLSTPLFANLLHQSLASYPALSTTELRNPSADAIVVLSANRYKQAPEYGEDTLGKTTLVRLRYAAYLHRQTGLPLIVSGGHVFDNSGKSLAQTMADSLVNDFHIHDVILEDQSQTTYENALYSKQLLEKHGFEKIYLVSSSSHMLRAMHSFQQLEVNTIAAPTYFHQEGRHWVMQLLPSAYSLADTREALHEWVGIVWYWIRHY